MYNNRCHAISYWWKRDKGDIRMAKSTVQIKVEKTYNLTTTREIKIAAGCKSSKIICHIQYLAIKFRKQALN